MRLTSSTALLLVLLCAAPAVPSPIVTDNCVSVIMPTGYPVVYATVYETTTAIATTTVQAPTTTLYTTSYITAYTTKATLTRNAKRAVSTSNSAAEKKLKAYCSSHPHDKQCRKTTSTSTSTSSACSKISVGIGIGPGAAIKEDFAQPVMTTTQAQILTTTVVQTSTEITTQTAPSQTATEIVVTTTTATVTAATPANTGTPATTGSSSVQDCTTGNQALLIIMSNSSVFTLPADPNTSVASYYIRYTAPDGTTQINTYTVTAELNGVGFLNEARNFCEDYTLECQPGTVYSGTEVLNLNVYFNGNDIMEAGDVITQKIVYSAADETVMACIKAITTFS